MLDILYHCHSSDYGGHFGGHGTSLKVLQSQFYWRTLIKDANSFVMESDRCQRIGNISRRQEMPLHGILEVELFDVWGIYFMGFFLPSNDNHYILVVVDYVSKWVATFPTNDAKVVTKFLKKKIFTRFGTPRASTSGEGSHFYNKAFESLLVKYGVKHKVATTYHL